MTSHKSSVRIKREILIFFLNWNFLGDIDSARETNQADEASNDKPETPDDEVRMKKRRKKKPAANADTADEAAADGTFLILNYSFIRLTSEPFCQIGRFNSVCPIPFEDLFKFFLSFLYILDIFCPNLL